MGPLGVIYLQDRLPPPKNRYPMGRRTIKNGQIVYDDDRHSTSIQH